MSGRYGRGVRRRLALCRSRSFRSRPALQRCDPRVFQQLRRRRIGVAWTITPARTCSRRTSARHATHVAAAKWILMLGRGQLGRCGNSLYFGATATHRVAPAWGSCRPLSRSSSASRSGVTRAVREQVEHLHYGRRALVIGCVKWATRSGCVAFDLIQQMMACGVDRCAPLPSAGRSRPRLSGASSEWSPMQVAAGLKWSSGYTSAGTARSTQ